MRYKLPDNVSSISSGGVEFIADDQGIIDVPDETAAHVVARLVDPFHHNLTPLTERSVAPENTEVDETKDVDNSQDDATNAGSDDETVSENGVEGETTTADKPARRRR